MAEKKTGTSTASRAAPRTAPDAPSRRSPPGTKTAPKAASPAKASPAPAKPAQARPDTAKMTPAQIAQAIIDGKLRPRVGELKRVAEALLGKLAPEKTAKAPKKGSKKSAAKKDKAKKADSKKAARKLAKIPGQKKKKK